MATAEATQTATGLTTMDIRAMREADTVCLDHPGTIRCIKRLSNPTPWEDERTYSITVRSDMTSYERNGCTYNLAYHYIGSAHFVPEWGTVCTLVKPGDELVLLWVVGNTSPFLERHELTQDEVKIVICRNKRPWVTLLIDTKVDNPYAPTRMVRNR